MMQIKKIWKKKEIWFDDIFIKMCTDEIKKDSEGNEKYWFNGYLLNNLN